MHLEIEQKSYKSDFPHEKYSPMKMFSLFEKVPIC